MNTHQPFWAQEALSHLETGVVIVDAEQRVVFVNAWVLARCGLAAQDMLGKPIAQCFPNLEGSNFESRLAFVTRTGLPATLSHSLHAPSFPLYVPHMLGEPRAILSQSIHIVPIGQRTDANANQVNLLIQINDVSSVVRRESLLRTRVDEMHQMARIDALTGIGNRREFDESLLKEIRNAIREKSPLGLILIDIDHFKKYNDHYGHPAGDQCLRAVANTIRQVIRRPRDRLARYGGEELVVVLPATPIEGVLGVGRDILHSIQNLQIPHITSEVRDTLSISAGAASICPITENDAITLVKQTDESLYQAKATGRNRMCYKIAGSDQTITI
jgi:diguanylate cyclase (GGDEF)-like protein